LRFATAKLENIYAWNNDSYKALNELFVHARHLLEGDRFRVQIRLRGDWIDKHVWLIFSTKDKQFSIESYEEGIYRGNTGN